MPEESEIQKLKKEYPEFFEQFSSEFLEFIFSEDTAFKIVEICLKNNIENDKIIEKIASRITLALLNQVPKENLAAILEKGVNLNREIAEKISIEVNRQIFSQAPEILREEERPVPPAPPSPEVKPSPEIKPEVEPKEKRKDVYREPIE